MNRRELLAHLREHGCELHRRGGRHDVWWKPETREMTSVPRHKTIRKPTARGICKDLGVPKPPGL